jgi:hypothetical protein
MRLCEKLDHGCEGKHRPRRFAEDEPCDVVRPRDEAIAGGHLGADEPLDAPEKLLVLELLVREAHKRLERRLVAKAVLGAHFDHLRADEALDEAEHVRVRAPLHLGEEDSFFLREEVELADFRKAVRQEFLRKIELAPTDDVAVDVPADALGHCEAPRIAPGVDRQRLGFGGFQLD